jgi:hypothetical protein
MLSELNASPNADAIRHADGHEVSTLTPTDANYLVQH